MEKVLGVLSVIGRFVGVLGRQASGEAVPLRKTRLAASATALLAALGAWAGLPEPVAQALADFLVALGIG